MRFLGLYHTKAGKLRAKIRINGKPVTLWAGKQIYQFDPSAYVSEICLTQNLIEIKTDHSVIRLGASSFSLEAK